MFTLNEVKGLCGFIFSAALDNSGHRQECLCYPNEDEMARVLALVDDLFFQAKMLETAKHVGVELECVATGEALIERARQNPPALIVIDLNARCGGIDALERLAPGNHLPVIAFLSHVQVELAERARLAGCREVMPRSRFTQDLANIFLQAKAQGAQASSQTEAPGEEV